MASGAQHYQEAENLIVEARSHQDRATRMEMFLEAQIHATLADAAATARANAANMPAIDSAQWNQVA